MPKPKISQKEVVDVELILPKFDNAGNPINPTYFNNILLSLADDVSNGFTVIPNAYGCWKNEKGEIQCEENFEVKMALPKDKEIGSKLKKLRSIETRVRRELGQKEVIYILDEDDKMTEIEGEGSEISPKSLKKVRINLLPEFIR